MPDASQRTSTIAEKSACAYDVERANENISRAAAASGMGTRAAFAALRMSVRSFWARSIVNPGLMSPASTYVSYANTAPTPTFETRGSTRLVVWPGSGAPNALYLPSGRVALRYSANARMDPAKRAA